MDENLRDDGGVFDYEAGDIAWSSSKGSAARAGEEEEEGGD